MMPALLSTGKPDLAPDSTGRGLDFQHRERIMTYRTLALAAPLLMAFATPVNAAEYIITYEGTISSGYDQTGVFGAIGDLTGQAFKIVYTLTARLPTAYSKTGANYFRSYGGTGYGNDSPLSALISVGGTSFQIDGQYYGHTQILDNFNGFDGLIHESRHFYESGNDVAYNFVYSTLYSTINDFISSVDYSSSLEYTAQSDDTAEGYFSLYESDDNVITRYANGYLVPTRVTIAPAMISGAVPEPATWALLITGFAAVGGALRLSRRKRRELRAP